MGKKNLFCICFLIIIIIFNMIRVYHISPKHNRDATMFYIHLAEKYTSIKAYKLSNLCYKTAIKISIKPTVWLDYNIAKNIILDEWNKPLTPSKKENLKKAIQHLDIEIKKYPTNGDINAQYAYAYEQLEEYDKAIEYYKKVIEKIGDWEYGYTRLAYLYDLVKKDYNTALNHVDKALKIATKENKANLYFRKAFILSGLKREQEAIEYYKEYLEENPNSVAALVNITGCEITVKDYENAKIHLKRGLKLNPYSSYLLKSEIDLLIHENKLDEAQLKAETLIEKNVYNKYIFYYKLGQIETKKGNKILAKKHFDSSKQSAQEYYDNNCDKPFDLKDINGKCSNTYSFLEDFEESLKRPMEL